MRILDRSVYVGPSLYAHFPVIRLELDLEALEAWPSAKLGEDIAAKQERRAGLQVSPRKSAATRLRRRLRRSRRRTRPA